MNLTYKIIVFILIGLCCLNGVAQEHIQRDFASLQTLQGEPFDWTGISTDKALFVLNGMPQCSGCEEQIYQFINTLDFSNCNLYIVYNGVEDYLLRRNLKTKIDQFLECQFMMLYINLDTVVEYHPLKTYQSYPKLILYSKQDNNYEVVENHDIFPTTTQLSDIRPGIRKRIERFIK